MESIIIDTFKEISMKFTISRLIMLLIVLVLTVGAYIALTIIWRQVKKHLNITDDIRRKHILATMFGIGKVLVIIGGIIAALQVVGFNMSGFAVALGAVTVVFILALKDSFQDIFSGVTILADHYFTVGDAVEFEGRDGIVTSFSVRSTKIQLLDDRSVMSIANRNITKIRRLTHLVDIDLPLSYDLDRKDAFRILEGICENIRAIDGIEKCELKGTQNFSESAAIYRIRFFCEPNDRPDIRRSVLKTIQDGLSDANIRIPYTQIDIHEK